MALHPLALPVTATDWATWLGSRISEHLDETRTLTQSIKADVGAPAARVLEQWNRAQLALRNVAAVCSLVSESHPDLEVRTLAEAGSASAQSLGTELGQDRDLYAVFAAIEPSDLDPLARRALAHTLRDFRRSGVDQSDDVRAQLKAMQERQTELSQAFARNIREDSRTVWMTPEQLVGMPDDFIAAHVPAEDGRIGITTDYPDYLPFMTFARDRAARHELSVAFLNRAWPQNEPVLDELLRLRAEMAQLLGYPDWPSYESEVKMIGSGRAIAEFIERIAEASETAARRDYDIVAERLRRDHPEADVVWGSDRLYYVNVLQRELFDVDALEVREYLDFTKVRNGLLDLTAHLFGLRYTALPGAPVWHESVTAYDVHLGDEYLGRIYLDLHPRAGKFSHAAAFELVPGLAGVQLSEGVLLCNFPDGLMEHRDVVTFFHEFGHLVHHMLAGRGAWAQFTGITTEWDFVEAPSQLLEEWAWDPAVLRGFATNAVGDPIPVALVERMRRAEEFGKGFVTRRQMALAAISYRLHQDVPADASALLHELQAQYELFAYPEDTHLHASFGHLDGYGAGYYTYMWSLVIAKDLFSAFDAEDLLSTEVPRRYRDAVLAAGGSADAATLIERFLGRPYAFDAFAEWLGRG